MSNINQWLQVIHQILSDPITILVATIITSIVLSRPHPSQSKRPARLKKSLQT